MTRLRYIAEMQALQTRLYYWHACTQRAQQIHLNSPGLHQRVKLRGELTLAVETSEAKRGEFTPGR
jgi:hypothetical protein